MDCKSPRIVLRMLLSSTLLLVSASPSLPEMATQSQIEQALRDLGNERFEVREAAGQKLFAAGMAAIPALKRGAAGEDQEVRSRAEKILSRFAMGVFADTPVEIAELVDRYQDADASDRGAILTELSRKGGYGYVVLTRLAEQEKDLWLHGQMMQMLAEHVDALPQSASVLLQQGDADGAERLLATGAATENELAIRAYSSLLRDQHKLGTMIAQMQRRFDLGAGEGVSAKALVYFYRAAEDLPHAAVIAEKSGDPALAEMIALESHDWKSLARLLTTSMIGQPYDLKRLGFLATVRRYAGDQKGFEETMDDLRRIHKSNPGNYWPAATTLLLNDRLEEATQLLAEQKRYATAFELYALAGKFDEALALLPKAKADDYAEAPTLMAISARMLWRVGEAQKARTLLDEVSANPDKSLSAYNALVEVQREMGRSDPAMLERARGNAVKVLRLIEAGARGGGNAGAIEKLFEKIYADRAPATMSLWTLLAPNPSSAPNLDAPWNAALNQLDKALDRRLTPEEWENLFVSVDDPITRSSNPAMRMWRLEQLIDALDAAGQSALADKCFARLVDLFKSTPGAPREFYLYVPKRMIRQKQWPAAVDACNVCAAKGGAGPDLRWLQGYALHLAGRAEEGDKLMALAKRSTFGDDQRLAALADMMAEYDRADESLQLRKDMIALGATRNYYFYDAFWRKARADAEKDPAAATADWQTYSLIIPDAGGTFTRESAYFEVPRAVHLHHARAMYVKGDTAGALAELREVQSHAPLNIEMALECVPELKKLGHAAAARKLFDLAYKPLDAFCAAHSSAAFYHNEIAWLCARCGYELDAAMAHAKRAVELEPRETNSLDTLAEIYFRRGEREKAVELMKQCESIEPHQPRHRQRRDEFEKGGEIK